MNIRQAFTLLLLAGAASCADNPVEPALETETGAELPTAVPEPAGTGWAPVVPTAHFNSVGGGGESGGPTVTTDKLDYQPGDTVTISGSGWLAGETVELLLEEEPQTHDPLVFTSVVDEDGNFVNRDFIVQDHDLGVTFTLTATGLTSGLTAGGTFTDNIPNSFTAVLNGAASVTVAPGATISLAVTARVTTQGGAPTNWKSTGWVLLVHPSSTPAGKLAGCVNTVDVSGSGMSGTEATRTFNITAPATPGVYDLHLKLSDVDGDGTDACGGTGAFTAKAFNNAVTVQAPANVAPVVGAGGPYSGAEGSAIALSGATAVDGDGDALLYTWSVNTTGIDPFGVCTFSPSNAVLNPSVTCTDDSQGASAGKFTLTLEVNDQQGHVVSANADLTVTNVNPAATAGGPYSGDEGSAIQLSGSGSDAGTNDELDYQWTVTTTGMDTGGDCAFDDATKSDATVTCTDDSGAGSFSLHLVVTDDDGGTSTTSDATLTVANVNPTADAGGPYSGDEGSAIQLSGSGSDAGTNDELDYQWTVTTAGIDSGGGCSFDDATKSDATVTCTDDSGAGSFTLHLVVTDDDGGTSTTSDASLTVANVPPVITSVVLSPASGGNIYPITGQPTVDATRTDAGSNDTHTCIFELFNMGVEVGVDRTCGAGLGAPEAGVYEVRVTVTDDDGGSDTESVQVVVYDPSAGFVTGGGWINSAAGAYKPDLGLSGKATFGFVSKYKKGATRPDGNTEFQFHAGGMNFHSDNYEWLVVNQAGTNAQFKGRGTINGAGDYGFMLWALDNSTDKFRMKIWYDNGGEVVVYDNGFDQPIGSGSIVIHTGGAGKK